jgi:hypothetical protein
MMSGVPLDGIINSIARLHLVDISTESRNIIDTKQLIHTAQLDSCTPYGQKYLFNSLCM